MAKLRVSPWEYSAIRKNAFDMTEGEFVRWMLEKWPLLSNHAFEPIDIVVDWGSGAIPTGEAVPSNKGYILSIRLSR
jgi:hypothetical protein